MDWNTIINTVVSALATGVVGFVIYLIKERSSQKKEKASTTSLLSSAMLVLLRGQLVQLHREVIGRGNVTTAELQTAREMHDLYTSLGGNGPASHLIEDITRLRLVP